MKDIIIIGGGLSGLITAIRLARKDYDVVLIEKHNYPRHKVCGEYISMEVHDFLLRENLLPDEKPLPQINTLQISSAKGERITLPLKPGGFGISRYYYENYLYNLARAEGVIFHFEEAAAISFNNFFSVKTKRGLLLKGDLVIAAYGKRNKLDKKLERNFFNKKSPYVGIKFHAKFPEMDERVISLHNFSGGYCGICNVEDGITNFCYLVHRDKLKSSGNIEMLEQGILYQNPHLKDSMNNAIRLFERPLVINEISFETKSPVEGKVIMIGDAAGMITPLCGNGMAMAIHTAKIISDLIINNPGITLDTLLKEYTQEWRNVFATRLSWGRFIQQYFFGKNLISGMAVSMGRNLPGLASYLIAKTHGKEI